jgi:hypothetical protein
MVGQVLEHEVADRSEPLAAERGQDAVVERLPVGADS